MLTIFSNFLFAADMVAVVVIVVVVIVVVEAVAVGFLFDPYELRDRFRTVLT